MKRSRQYLKIASIGRNPVYYYQQSYIQRRFREGWGKQGACWELSGRASGLEIRRPSYRCSVGAHAASTTVAPAYLHPASSASGSWRQKPSEEVTIRARFAKISSRVGSSVRYARRSGDRGMTFRLGAAGCMMGEGAIGTFSSA